MAINRWATGFSADTIAQLSKLVAPSREQVAAILGDSAPQHIDAVTAMLNGKKYTTEQPAATAEQNVYSAEDVRERDGEVASTSSDDVDDWNFDEGPVVEKPQVNPAEFMDEKLRGRRFAPFAHQVDSPCGMLKVEVEAITEEGTQVLVYWDELPTSSPYVLYRLVGHVGEGALSPEDGTILVHTRGRAFREVIPASVGMRHYAVWAYAADSAPGTLAVQPVLVGEEAVGLPPRNIGLVEDKNGTVTGSWMLPHGVDQVEVYARVSTSDVPLYDPRHRVPSGVGLRNFTHTVAKRGKTYEFQLFPTFEFRGSRRVGEGSEIAQVQISANIQQVEMKEAVRLPSSKGDQISLMWAVPSMGEVRVYLTEKAPQADLALEVVEERHILDDDALGSTKWVHTYNFDEIDQYNPGEDHHAVVQWPGEWSQVFCVPVHVVGDSFQVGSYQVVNRVESIAEATLHERVSSQLVTFDWPKGASVVHVRTSRSRIDRYLVEEDYRRQGGVRLELSNLGDIVELEPRFYFGGTPVTGEKTTLNYDGLWIYRYRIRTRQRADRPGLELGVWLWREGFEDERPPSFVLVYNRSRLPLHAQDGEPLLTSLTTNSGSDEPTPKIVPELLAAHANAAAATSDETFWSALLSPGQSGYVRVFLADEHRHQLGSPQRVVVDDDAGTLEVNLGGLN
ncbi:hypothetical protein CCICO_10220 [Corynebacterium ciconiae DSM 44920]|uniref:hypothetical protein n=1 Tax=Corynebacterium ciconiae TaxID=227319 RepID=UPI00037F6720|nr:hypothetical protein [Corynebacterium ciconiae]WKD62043.1 hypothetical protein CCICO_10220 [Corynebacterium ciconiae DSM 44920]